MTFVHVFSPEVLQARCLPSLPSRLRRRKVQVPAGELLPRCLRPPLTYLSAKVYAGDIARAVEILSRGDLEVEKMAAGKIIEAGGPKGEWC